MKNPYHTVYWDISGVCNASCKYCPSGKRNLLGDVHRKQAGFLSPDDFRYGLHFLLNRNIITTYSTHVGLYSWGEPFLHPNFELMMDIIAGTGLRYSLSTNASTLKRPSNFALQGLTEIKFSVPGFSQFSYDHQHCFDFETICGEHGNIKKMVKAIRDVAGHINFILVFQIYNYNRHELDAAYDFCRSINIYFQPIVAHLTGFTMPFNGYPPAPNDFLTDGKFEDVISRQPQGWVCPQYDILVLDEFSNVVQCCATERSVPGYVIGNIHDVDFNNLKQKRMSAEVCKDCIGSGIGFIAHNVMP